MLLRLSHLISLSCYASLDVRPTNRLGWQQNKQPAKECELFESTKDFHGTGWPLKLANISVFLHKVFI